MNRKQTIDELTKTLEGPFGLTPFRNAKEVAEAETQSQLEGGEKARGVFKGPPITWAHHFEMQADLMIFDFELGTLGLIHVLPEPSDERSINAAVTDYLSDAAYLRHLLIRESDQKRTWPFTVVLVLVNPRSGDNEYRAQVGQALQAQQQHSQFLSEVEIGYVDDPKNRKDMQRGFAWLLTAVRGWFALKQNSGSPSGAGWPKFEKLTGLELDNYRNQNKRIINLSDGPANVHVMHGSNGTGKSALAESLEFIATGKIARFGDGRTGEFSYKNIISHDLDRSTQILLNTEKEEFTVEENTLGRPPSRPPFLVDPLSFRFNQSEIDGLTIATPTARAERYMRAFFPDEIEVRKALKELEKKRKQSSVIIHDLRATLEEGLSILERIDSWTAPRGSKRSSRPFKKVLDEWLHSIALTDMGKTQLANQETMANAEELGWVREPIIDTVLPQGNVDKLRIWLDETVSNSERLLRELHKHAGGASHSNDSTISISSSESQILDTVGKLVSSSTGKGCGALISKAIREAKPLGTDWGVIGGEPGWAESLIGQIRYFLSVEEVTQMPEDSPLPLPTTGKLAKVVRLFKEMQSTTAHSFASTWEDSSIAQAVNELMAVFTPARWAYKDIQIRLDEDGEFETLHFDYDGNQAKHAELILNNAELTLLSLSLFLLNAPKLANPFKLLVLDDPLQNLDELSVGALARGVNSLLRLSQWDKDWRILILVHSEGDCERIEQQLPCQRYRMPWLPPERVPIEKPVETHTKNSRSVDLLSIAELIQS